MRLNQLSSHQVTPNSNLKKHPTSTKQRPQTLRNTPPKIKASSSKSPNNMMSKTLNQVWNHSIKETSVELEHNEELGEVREKRNKIEALKELMKMHLGKPDHQEPKAKAVHSSKICSDLTIPWHSKGLQESNSKEDLIHIEDIKNACIQNKYIKSKRHTSASTLQMVATDRKLSQNNSKPKLLDTRANRPKEIERNQSKDNLSASNTNIHLSDVDQQVNTTYPMRRVQTEVEKLTKNIELKVIVVEVDGKKASKTSQAKISWRKSFQENPDPETSKIEIPEHQDVELEVYVDGRDEPLKKFSGVSCKPSTAEKQHCDMVIVDVSQHRHLIKVDRQESALFNEPDIVDSSPISSTEEKVNRKDWNCIAIVTDNQQQLEGFLKIVKASGLENSELHNGFLLESAEEFSHVLVKTTSNGRIYFKDDRANQCRILIYERSFIDFGQEKVHCYLVTTERDILESKKNQPVHMEYLCVTSESEFLVEPYGYLEGEFAELCLSDGNRYLGQLYYEKIENMHSTSDPMFALRFKISSSKHFTINLKPTNPHNTLETRLNHLCIPLLSKYQEMRSCKSSTPKTNKPKLKNIQGRTENDEPVPPTLHPNQNKPSFPKISLRDKRGETVLIFLSEEDSIDSSDLSDSFESDCFYPDDEIYRVEVNGKLHAPVFKKLRNGATPHPQTKDEKVEPVHTAISPQGYSNKRQPC